MKLPPTFCITIDHPTFDERRKIALSHFEKHGLDVQPLDGMHGARWGLDTSIKFKKKNKPGYWRASPAIASLTINHWCLWKHMQLSGMEEVLILEDDAYITPKFKEKYFEARRKLPADWHCLFVGWIDSHAPDRKMTEVNKPIYRCEGGAIFGTHAMLLNRKGMKVMLDTQQKLAKGIDVQIYDRAIAAPNIKFNYYVCYPSIIKQRTMEGNWKSTMGVTRDDEPLPT